MDASTDPDLQCMARLRDGDDPALNEIMLRWKQKLANYISRFVGNEADAINLTQEVFVRVYENRLRYECRGAFSTWLFQIATNLCKNHLRWRSRHPEVSLDETFEENEKSKIEPVSPAPTPFENLLASEQAREVREAVSELPHDLRVIVLLYEFEDLSYAQISEILKCTIKTVETRLYRARKTLSKRLGAAQVAEA